MKDLQGASVKDVVNEDELNVSKPLYGVGGFLYLAIIGLVLTFFGSVIILFDSLSSMSTDDFRQLTDRDEHTYSLLWTVNFWSTITYSIVSMVFVLINGYLCFKKKKLFKWMMISFYAMILIANIIFYFLGMFLNEEASYYMIDESELSQTLIISAIVFIIWGSYFLRSRRVKNTFIM